MSLAAMSPARRPARLALFLIVIGCSTRRASAPPATAPRPTRGQAPPGVTESAGRLPPVPLARGPLRLDVVYPPRGAAVAVEDSSFLLGSVGDGMARLRGNGTPVRVWPNGAFI